MGQPTLPPVVWVEDHGADCPGQEGGRAQGQPGSGADDECRPRAGEEHEAGEIATRPPETETTCESAHAQDGQDGEEDGCDRAGSPLCAEPDQ